MQSAGADAYGAGRSPLIAKLTSSPKEHAYASMQGHGEGLAGVSNHGTLGRMGGPRGGGGPSQKDGKSRQQMRIQPDLNPAVGQLYSSICFCKGAVVTVLLAGQSLLSLLSTLQAQS